MIDATLQYFIATAQSALDAFRFLGSILSMPIREAAVFSPVMTAGPMGWVLPALIGTADFFGQTWIGNISIIGLLFSGGTLVTIILVGLIRWIIDILP